MNISFKLDQLHLWVRGNKWLWYFAVFNRIALAAGFLPSGLQKVIGERFTALPVNHPMGHFLDAFYLTGYYYTFVGILQVTAAILLLIPRAATFGAIIYFPIILNICILSLAVRFDGSLLSAPLMVLANLYLLCWDYHKLKFIFPFTHPTNHDDIPQKGLSSKFPKNFFLGVVVTVFMVVLVITNAYNIVPHNTLSECKKQCQGSDKSKACNDFCDCIHVEGQSLNKCLEEYYKVPEDSLLVPKTSEL